MAPEKDIQQVQDDIVVSMDYTLRLDDGEVVDTSEGQQPLEFLQGRGQIITGLEQELYGMGIGEEKEVAVSPEEGYGEYDEERVQSVPRETFPDDMELEEGLSVRMRDANSGQVFDAFVEKLQEENVVLDFNHPLAGETLFFDVKIAGLREPSTEELDQGQVAQAGQ